MMYKFLEDLFFDFLRYKKIGMRKIRHMIFLQFKTMVMLKKREKRPYKKQIWRVIF